MLVIVNDKPTEAFKVLSAGQYTRIPSQTLSILAAVRWRSSVIPISDWSVSAVMDKTEPAHTHTHTHTQAHKCRVEAPMMAVTGRQLGPGPAVLWEMTLFGPIKVRLCVDTSIHMIITV